MYHGRTLIVVLLAVNINTSQLLVAQPPEMPVLRPVQAPVAVVGRQEIDTCEVMHDGHWVPLRGRHWLALEERLAAKQGVPERAALEDSWPVRISDAAFDLQVFGRTENGIPSVKKDLHVFLGHLVEEFTERYGL